MLFKIELPPTLNSYYYKNNNNNKYKQSSMNISEDITIKTNIKQKSRSDCRIPSPAIYMCRYALKNQVYNNSCYSY